MRLLPKISELMKRSEVNRQRCELRIADLRRQSRDLVDELAALQRQRDEVVQRLACERPRGRLDRSGLFSGQRRLAVLRRQVSEMALRECTLTQQLTELDQRVEAASIEQRRWRRKQDKYQVVVDRERQHLRLTRLHQDETELQEIMTCR